MEERGGMDERKWKREGRWMRGSGREREEMDEKKWKREGRWIGGKSGKKVLEYYK